MRTYELSCECGYGVRCEVKRYGQQLGGLVFFDDEVGSPTRGQRLTRCPGCHDHLGLPGLRS